MRRTVIKHQGEKIVYKIQEAVNLFDMLECCKTQELEGKVWEVK